MFNFVVRYLGFLKHMPGTAFLFDCWLRIVTLFNNPVLLDYMDEIEGEVLKWRGTIKTLHKYGGVQFNYGNREIGHIHGNGLLDMLLNKNLKQQLMEEGKVLNHHVFKNTGWVSFYIKNKTDKDYAINLLRIAYQFHERKHLISPCGYHQTALPAVVTMFAQVNTLPDTQSQPAITNGNSYRCA